MDGRARRRGVGRPRSRSTRPSGRARGPASGYSSSIGEARIRILRSLLFRTRRVLGFALTRFFRIDGAQGAAAFAFNAFLSVFPALLLLVMITSAFVDADTATAAVTAYLERFVPLQGHERAQLVEVLDGVVRGRASASFFAIVTLVLAALQGFSTLIHVTNAAWGKEPYAWWRLPPRSLGLLAATLFAALLGVTMPLLARAIDDWLFLDTNLSGWAYAAMATILPVALVPTSLALFYSLAPRKPVRFTQVWVGAVVATGMLWIAQGALVLYIHNFMSLNAVYGAFGTVTAALLWIYVSGCIFIFGACLCAALAELRDASTTT